MWCLELSSSEKKELTCFDSEICEPKRLATCHPQARYMWWNGTGESKRNISILKGQEEETHGSHSSVDSEIILGIHISRGLFPGPGEETLIRPQFHLWGEMCGSSNPCGPWLLGVLPFYEVEPHGNPLLWTKMSVKHWIECWQFHTTKPFLFHVMMRALENNAQFGGWADFSAFFLSTKIGAQRVGLISHNLFYARLVVLNEDNIGEE